MKILVSGAVEIHKTIKKPVVMTGVGYQMMRALKTLGADVYPYPYLKHDEKENLILEGFKTSGFPNVYLQQTRIKGDQLPFIIDRDIDLFLLTNHKMSRPFLSLAKQADKLICVHLSEPYDLNDLEHKDFLEHANILWLNDKHLRETPAATLQKIADVYDTEVVIALMGDKGLFYYTKQTEIIRHIKAIDIRDINFDMWHSEAIVSGFIYFFLKGHPVEQALIHANYFASHKNTKSKESPVFLSEKALIEIMKEDHTHGLY